MIEQIFIDAGMQDSPVVAAILGRFRRIQSVVVDGLAQVEEELKRTPDPVTEGKKVLFLTANRGSFIKKCPGTKSYLCCGYQILHIGTYCTMDCSYCILQAYFEPPVLQFFANVEDLFDELGGLVESDPAPFHRIGTGEFTDSLIWEPWTELSSRLVPFFGGQNRMVLELKTKTANVQGLAGLSHDKKTIVAWSLNTPAVIGTEERGTASLDGRLRAAVQCQDWGYPLAFHFDPLILYDGWERDYQAVVEKLFRAVSPESVVWVSVGSFRFMPALKPILRRRFPKSRIAYGEFIQGLDGKMRYFKPLRIELYKKMVDWIRKMAPEVCVYLCMEDQEVWQKSVGIDPEGEGGVARMLDMAAARHCGVVI